MKHSKVRQLWLVLLIVLMLIPTSASFSFGDDGSAPPEAEWWNFRNTQTNNAVTSRPTPTDDKEAWGKWAQKYGSGYAAAPTPPIIVNGKLYIGSGNTVKEIDRETGEEIRTSEKMPGNVGYAMQSPVYADGKIFVAIANGRISAINIDDMTLAWTTDNSEIIKGQTVSPISYKKINGTGYIYTGTWTNKGGELFCATTDDNNVSEDASGNKIKSLTWHFNPAEVDAEDLAAYNEGRESGEQTVAVGYYWTGAYVTDNYLAIGSDNGSTMGDEVNDTAYYTLNPTTGEIIDKVYGIKGQVRSTTVYDEGNLYFSTKGCKVYKIPVDENGNLGEPSYIALGNFGASMATATPVVYNGKIYLGVSGKGGQFDAAGGHSFMVIRNDETLSDSSFVYSIPVPGYPQAGALLSTYNEDVDFDEDGEPDKRVYLYYTYNAQPGGIFYTYDTPNQIEPTNLSVEEAKIFVPAKTYQQYCISSIVVDNNGVLYYKNDSGALFAVESNSAILKNMQVFDEEGTEVVLDQAFQPKMAEYNGTVGPEDTKVTLKLQLEDGVTATVGEVDYSAPEIEVSLPETITEIPIVTSKDGKSRSYKLSIRKKGATANLIYARSNDSNSVPGATGGVAFTPELNETDADYIADWSLKPLGSTKTFYNLWLEGELNTTIKVYPVENIKQNSSIQADGTIKRAAVSGTKGRWALYFDDKAKPVKVKVEVTSETGTRTRDYFFTMDPMIHVADIMLDKSEVTLVEDETIELKADITPSNASDKSITWNSSDESVAIVDENGNVTAVAAGKAVITATTVDGGKTDNCEITVDYKMLEGENAEATLGLNQEAILRANGPIDEFESFILDGRQLEKDKDYSISEGSTIVTLKRDFVASLDTGIHNYEVIFENGKASGTLTINKGPNTEFSIKVDGVEVSADKIETQPSGYDASYEDWQTNEKVESIIPLVTVSLPCDAENVSVTLGADGDEYQNYIYTKEPDDSGYTQYVDYGFGDQVDDYNKIAYGGKEYEITIPDPANVIRVQTAYDASFTSYNLYAIAFEADHGTLAEVAATEATCTAAGNIAHWKCNACGKLFQDEAGTTELSNEDVVVQAGHTWGKPTYEWTLSAYTGNYRVKGTAVCEKDETHTKTKTVTATKDVDKDVTATEDGQVTWTATFTDEPFTTQTKVEIVPAYGEETKTVNLIGQAEDNKIVSVDGKLGVLEGVKVNSQLATQYGYTKPADMMGKVTALDALVALHKELYGNAFENDPTAYLKTSGGTMTELFGIETTNFVFHVNDSYPIYPDKPGIGSVINDTLLADGDTVRFFNVESDMWGFDVSYLIFDKPAFGENSTYEVHICEALEISVEFKCALAEMGGMPPWDWEPAEDATVVIKNEDDEVIATATANEDGVATFGSLPVGEYYAVVSEFMEPTYYGESFSTPYAKVTVLNHDTEMTEEEPATCTEAGTKAYWTCSACGKMFSDAEGTTEITKTETIEALGHTPGKAVKENEVAATCEKAGSYDEVVYCEVCKVELSRENKSVEALGHKWDEGKVTKPATETLEGEKTFTCQHDSSHTKTEAIPKLDHKHNMIKTAAKKATCLANGNIEYYTCRSCNRIYKDAAGKTVIKQSDTVIEATGHKYGEWKVTKNATCTAAGTEERVCANDKSHKETRSLKAIGHKWDEGKVTKEPTRNKEGVRTFTCQHDSKHTKTEKIAKLGITLERIYENNRYGTAHDIGSVLRKEKGGAKYKNVIIASGLNFPDALSGAYLAKVKEAPIVLSNSGSENSTVEFIKNNVIKGGQVYILGGEKAVPKSIERKLSGYWVKRLSGANRYDTNIAILKEAGVKAEDIMVCSGTDYPDALSASAVGKPILLVGNTLTPNQKAYLKTLKSKKYYLIGGTKAVTASAAKDVAVYGDKKPERVQGQSRFETSVKVAERFFKNPKAVVLAYAMNYPDGLTGAPLAIQLDGPIILADSNNANNKFAKEYVKKNAIAHSITLGGPKLISDEATKDIMSSSSAVKRIK